MDQKLSFEVLKSISIGLSLSRCENSAWNPFHFDSDPGSLGPNPKPDFPI